MSAPGFGKDPLNPSHGDSLVDQSFQSLKSKEVRDSISPTGDLKFHSMSLNHPSTTGWDVQTSSEVSPDGRAYCTETVAKTDGVEKINGGTAEFRGRNEQRASASHQGDDKNFVKKASESSNTHLQEHVVVGDENSGRTEMKTSSTTTSSSQVISSSSTVEYDGTEPSNNRYLMDNTNRQRHDQHQQRLTQDQQHRQQHRQQHQHQLQHERQQHHDHEQNRYTTDQSTIKQSQQQQQYQHQQQQQTQEQHQFTEEYNRNRQESSTSRNVEARQVQEQSRRIVDMDKASPEYQQHVQYLMTQPGEIISNTVEYPKPNVKMITTVKRLPDGTIVKNKRYETEELQPTVDSTRQRTTSTTSQTSTQRKNEQRQRNEENIYNRQQNVSDDKYSKNSPRQPERDVVDNVETLSHVQDNKHQLVEPHPTSRYTDDSTNVETKFSSVKKSSRRFSTETTSETIEEYSDQSPNYNRGKPSHKQAPQGFSTQGFPSVRSNKPTQEFPTDRPRAPQPPNDFSTYGFPSVRPDKPTQEYPTDRSSALQSTEVERHTQHTVTDSKKPTTSAPPHGYLAVRPNSTTTTTKDGDVIIVSSEATRTSKFKTNAERVIETEVITDGDYTSTRPEKIIYSSTQSTAEDKSTRQLPVVKQASPSKDFPSGPHKSHPPESFSTHGFPSVRSPTNTPDYSTHGFPSNRDVIKTGSHQPHKPGETVRDGEVTIVSSETQKTAKHNTNREHIITTEIKSDDDYKHPSGLRQPDTITFPTTPQQPGDNSTHGFPSVNEKSPVGGGTPKHGTPSHEYPSSPGKSQPLNDYSTHGYPSAKSPTKTTTDYSNRGSPVKSTPLSSSQTTRKTTTTDTTQRLIQKEKEVDAAHRAFAASLRSSSPVDSIDHHRQTPRSSISSRGTYRRDLREGSNESHVPSETSRISSGTVTRHSPTKSVGKSVVTKQTVVKTRNVNGSNETIDLTLRKSPSPSKTVTTTTTRTTTTRKTPTEVPKSEKSPHLPAQSNHLHRTHPKSKSPPVRDDYSDDYDEPSHQPLSSSVIEPKTSNRTSPGPKSSGPKTICQPEETSVERRTVVRETTFEKPDWQQSIIDETEQQFPVKNDYPLEYTPRPHQPKQKSPKSGKHPEDTTDIMTSEIIFENIDSHDYPRKTIEPVRKTPDIKTTITKTNRKDKPVPIEQISKKPVSKKPSNDEHSPTRKASKIITTTTVESSHKNVHLTEKKDQSGEPVDSRPFNKKPTSLIREQPASRKPQSPTRKPSDTKTLTSTTTTIEKTPRDKFRPVDGDLIPDSATGKKPTMRKPSEPLDSEDIRNSTKKTFITTKSTRKDNVPIDRKPTSGRPSEPLESDDNRSPTRKTSDFKTSSINTETTITKETRKDKLHPMKDNDYPLEPPGKRSTSRKPPQPIEEDDDRRPSRKTTTTTTVSTFESNRKGKPHLTGEKDYPSQPIDKKPTSRKPSRPVDEEYDSSPTRKTSDIRSSTNDINTTTSKTIQKNITRPTEENGFPVEPIDKRPVKKQPYDSDDNRSPTKKTSNIESYINTTMNTKRTTHKDKTRPTEDHDFLIEPVNKKPASRKPSEIVNSDDDRSPTRKTSTITTTIASKTTRKNKDVDFLVEPVDKYPTSRQFPELVHCDDNRSPTRKSAEITTTISSKTSRKDKPHPIEDDDYSGKPDLEKPTSRKSSESVDSDGDRSPTREALNPELLPITTVTNIPKTTRKDKLHPIEDNNYPVKPDVRKPTSRKSTGTLDSDGDRSPTRKTSNIKSSTITTTTNVSETTRKEKPYLIEDDDYPVKPDSRKPISSAASVDSDDDRISEGNQNKTCLIQDEDSEITFTTSITKVIPSDYSKPGTEKNEIYPSRKEPTHYERNESTKVQELFEKIDKTKVTQNIKDDFISTERRENEITDGAFISKSGDTTPKSPTYKKKGVASRETFEERCRQILGMENYGDTQGTYQKRPSPEKDIDFEPIKKESSPNTIFDVKIEDCDDDESNYLSNIKETIKPRKPESTTSPKDEPKKPTKDDKDLEEVECFRTEKVMPFEPKQITGETKLKMEAKDDTMEVITKPVVKTTTDQNKSVKRNETDYKTTIRVDSLNFEEPKTSEPDTSSSESESPEMYMEVDSENDSFIYKDTAVVEETKKIPFNKTSEQKSPSQRSSPTRSPSRKLSAPDNKPGPQKHVSETSRTKTSEHVSTKYKTTTKPSMQSPIKPEPDDISPINTTKSTVTTQKHHIVKKDGVLPKQKPQPTSPTKMRKESVEKIMNQSTTVKQQSKPNTNSPQTTIKDRLRLSTRNRQPTSDETDKNSSPDTSPIRSTERRRSSNISVHTEIIIDHTPPKSPQLSPKFPEKQKLHPKQPVNKTETTSSPKSFRRLPVTERKESAPVYSVTRKEKDAKMTRSTSEKVMKVTGKPTKKPEVNSLSPDSSPKTDRRPNKCFTTKTINLTTTDKLINSQDMENVVIDIQHAKSSREPSPDKIVPTPVPVYLDTGKPRYPDVVQEPEDEPGKKPVVKNIPIYEEESNEYINCHISEVNIDKTSKPLHFDEEDILDNPTIEAPKSLDYPSIDRTDDDCLLSVHEKVSKFTHTAEEVKKPKVSSPFNRELDKTPRVPDDDDCLLTVDEKVNKFIRTAENVTKPITSIREIKRPKYEDLDEDLRKDDCVLSVSQKVNKFINTSEKLVPSAPQKSPLLVAKIERTISKQSEPEYPEGISDDEILIPFSENHTVELEKKRQKDILSRHSVFEKNIDVDDTVEIQASPIYNRDDIFEDDEIVPMTKEHTTQIELKRQKDILSRPSVFESSVQKKPTGSKTSHRVGTVKKAEYTAKKHSNVKHDETEIVVERKPFKTAQVQPHKTNGHKSPTKPQSSAVSVTRSRFETPINKKPVHSPLRSHPKNIESPSGSRRKPSNETETIPHREPNEVEYQTTESETEFMLTTHRSSLSKTKDYVRTELGRVSPTKPKESTRTITSQEIRTKPKYTSHSPTPNDTTSTQTSVTKVTQRTFKHTSPSETSDTEIVETILERPKQVKSSPVTVGRTRATADTVAARRNIFEKNVATKQHTPSTPSPTGRRPSYMDHTKSSLEHIRRDSLEVNKSNYSRKSSVEDDTPYERRPNTAVKFDVPHKPQRGNSIPEDIDIESIFELEVLEHMLETVTSYELRRRIRAQIRLVKKNMLNTEIVDKIKSETKTSTSISSTHKSSTYSSKVHHEETDTFPGGVHHEKHYERTPSPKRNLKTKKDMPYGRTESPLQYSEPHDKSRTTTESQCSPIPRDRSESPKRPSKSSPIDHTPRASYPRNHSPELATKRGSVKESRRTSDSRTATHKEYTRSEHHTEELFSSSTEHSPERNNRKPYRERSYSPEPKAIGKTHVISEHDRSGSPGLKSKPMSHTARNQSPDDKVKPKQPYERIPIPQTKPAKQREESLYSVSKITSVRNAQSPERKSNKPKTDEKTPIWADRKNVLKNQGSSAAYKTPTTPTARTTSATKTTTNLTNQRQIHNRNIEEDSITSSYGIGPTDENGLPLFGIKALKKKKPTQPCETTEEVTGYVIEEKYYSDNKTKPTVERKEYIYSTNADELEEIKKSVEKTRKPVNDDVDVIRKFEKIEKEYLQGEPRAISSGSEELDATTSKYVRRGSVKELSEKFIRKESSQSITEKTSGYPKAGLIFRSSQRGATPETAGIGTYETTNERYTKTSSGDNDVYRPVAGDTDDDEHNVELRYTRRMATASDNDEHERESMERELRTQTTRMSTRSFLNSSGETKIVTGVDDVLQRMRNADNVMEEGDTAEDREARSLLNKFLGASVIMKGVEGALPPTTKQTTTTTITKTCYTDDGSESDHLRNQAVKTTRVTKTTKPGSSSSPVTRTTCDIEEICDEEILKELLEAATTYEERRKIRARLRELMAEREAQQQQQQQSTSTTEKTETEEKDGAIVTTTTKVTTRTVSGTGTAPKPVSPFAKFKQLDKQNSLQSQKSPSTPTTPGGSATPTGSARIFQFTDPALNARAATVKDQLLQWCQMKTREYENVQITNFSTCWTDGLAFCALIHHFLPDAFDYSKLTPQSRRHNFELAFTVADEKAGIAPLLDVEDMVVMKRPDWKCVFVYVQSIYRRFRNCQ